MQRDRVARAYFQDVRRAAIKVSPYHVLRNAGYLVATRHSWAPADYVKGNSKSSHPACPRAMAISADRCEGIAVAEVCSACGSVVASSILRTTAQYQIRTPDCVLCQGRPKDGASNETFPVHAK